MPKKTRAELEADIASLEDAGLDTTEEKAQLKQMVLAGAGKPKAEPSPAPAATPSDEEDFVNLNTESYESGGGGWTAPVTTGIKDAICEGLMVPDFVADQLWFIFKNPEYPGGDEPFRGALVCGSVSAESRSGAWKVKEVAIALGIEGQLKVVEGQGIRGLKACAGKACQVLWDDIAIKGKTERRIQDVMAPGSEAAM